MSGHGTVDDLPDLFLELDVLNVLCQIIQSPEKAEGVAQGRYGGVSQTRGNTHPCLFTDPNHDSILNTLEGNGQSSLSAGLGTHARSDLDGEFVCLPEGLRVQVPAIEFGHEGMSNVIGFDVSVKDSSFHDLDYNPFTKRRRCVVVFHVW